MSWAKLDDRYDDNRKIKRAWRRAPVAVGLHAMAITYCSRHDLDGVVDIDWIEERLPEREERDLALTVLTEIGLFDVLDDEHWYVHDFLEYNPSRHETEARSRLKAEAGRLGGLAKARAAKASAKQATSTVPEDGLAPAVAPARGVSSTASSPVPSRPVPSQPETASSGEPDIEGAQQRLKSSAEQQIFDTWIKATGRTNATILTDKRRRLIRNALKLYSLADVTDAVEGWRHSPHHRGENAQGTIYNDLELLLRDAEHIEKFRDLNRNGGGAGAAPPKLSVIHAAERAHRERKDGAA